VRVAEGQWERLQFLARVTHKECLYLHETDNRLFADPMTLESLQKMEKDPVLISALQAGHKFVPVLITTAQRLAVQIGKLAP
jgi:hypothetical protein